MASIPRRRAGFLLYTLGLISAGLVLFLDAVATGFGWNITGYYVCWVVPIGAIVLGLIGGMGFALASRFTNVRLRRVDVYIIGSFSLIAWFAIQYLKYSAEVANSQVNGYPFSLSFLEYMLEVAESFTFKGSQPLGYAGYVIMLLEMAGFVLGGLIPALYVFGLSYCEACGRYLRKTATGHVTHPMSIKELMKFKREQRDYPLQKAIDEVEAETRSALAGLAGKLPESIEETLRPMALVNKNSIVTSVINLLRCPECSCHQVDASLVHIDVMGKDRHTQELFKVMIPAS